MSGDRARGRKKAKGAVRDEVEVDIALEAGRNMRYVSRQNMVALIVAAALTAGGSTATTLVEAADEDARPPALVGAPACRTAVEQALAFAAAHPKIRRLIARPGVSNLLPFDKALRDRCQIERYIEAEYGAENS